MTDTIDTSASGPMPEITAPVVSLEQGQDRIKHLLAGLQSATSGRSRPRVPSATPDFDSRLALVRLGIATSLFYAIRTKHAPTAAHSLRVALSCSVWTERMGLDESERDRIEVAALLHDLGKIGIPDRILRKPGRLTPDEQVVMETCPQMSCEILRGCTSDSELLDIVRYCNTWFESRRHDDRPGGEALPLGSRMLSIADAFDAMTTDTVYRSAMSRERATQELINGSCSQFDPNLAADFGRMLEDRPEILHGAVVDRWLRQLQPNAGDSMWTGTVANHGAVGSDHADRFHQHLVRTINDGVIYTDSEGTITQWNEVMRQLTGIAAAAIVGNQWSEDCVRLRAQDSERLSWNSMVEECISATTPIAQSMVIEQPGAEPTPVQVQISPVLCDNGCVQGTVVTVRDLSERTSLRKQLQTLHHQTTRDPLTGVANRSCFDQTLDDLTEKTQADGSTFSLIICDVDHFKRVNDTHGHPAGDAALMTFSNILNSHSRDGDLVARYGGEEFLLLAPNCDNATATHRAEAIRRSLEQTRLPSLNGQRITASFGVTEFQLGDSSESVLARADRALLKAKDNGRNRVVQLGSGNHAETIRPEPKRGWLSWFDREDGFREIDILTPVPVDLTIEKLRGFIADHSAEIINVGESQVSLRFNARCVRGGRRRVDQTIPVRVELTLSERRDESRGRQMTNVHVVMQARRSRERRGQALSSCFSWVLQSLNGYLMGEVSEGTE